MPTRLENRAFRARSWPLLAFVATTLLARPGTASDAVRFEYSAPEGCPSQADFAERVAERALHERTAAEGELARSFIVAVVVETEGVSARVDFVDSDGNAVFRTMRGATCDEVVSGIALVVALAIDARATKEELVPPAPLPDQPRPQPPTAPTARAAAEPPADAPRPRESQGPGLVFQAGLGAGYASHTGPSGGPTFQGFFSAMRSARGPSLRAGAFHFRSDAVTPDGKQASFRGYGLRLEGCPLSLALGPFFAEPCLGTDAGVVHAAGKEGATVETPREPIRGLWGGVLLARFGALVSGLVVLEAQGELAVPFIRHRFGFGEPPLEQTVFQVPALGFGASGAVGVRFP